MALNDRLSEELEFLLNVYTEDEVSVQYSESGEVSTVTMTIHPATAGNVEEQYVCLNLLVHIPQQYPEECPNVTIRNPRGLSENEIIRLENTLLEYMESEKGNPVLMQLFELARDTLTNSNVPHGDCSICLSDFLNTEREFIRTECYHYFHSSCIGKYKAYWDSKVKSQQEETTLPTYQENKEEDYLFRCPDCRKPISVPDDLLVVEEEMEESCDYEIDERLRTQQKEWREMFKKQQAQGGIIDVEQEREKYRLPPPREPAPTTLPIPADGDNTEDQALPDNSEPVPIVPSLNSMSALSTHLPPITTARTAGADSEKPNSKTYSDRQYKHSNTRPHYGGSASQPHTYHESKANDKHSNFGENRRYTQRGGYQRRRPDSRRKAYKDGDGEQTFSSEKTTPKNNQPIEHRDADKSNNSAKPISTCNEPTSQSIDRAYQKKGAISSTDCEQQKDNAHSLPNANHDNDRVPNVKSQAKRSQQYYRPPRQTSHISHHLDDMKGTSQHYSRSLNPAETTCPEEGTYDSKPHVPKYSGHRPRGRSQRTSHRDQRPSTATSQHTSWRPSHHSRKSTHTGQPHHIQRNNAPTAGPRSEPALTNKE